METLKGILERVTYVNEENSYSVFKIRVKGYLNLVTITGIFPFIPIGTVLLVKGKWATHPSFGKQFEVQEWEESLPADIYGIGKYLGSGLIKGVGPKFAHLIIEKFGTETLHIIEENPERLFEIEKIGSKRVEQIRKSWKDQREIRDLMIFLGEHGISSAYGHRIYKVYGKDSIQVLKDNPYQMIEVSMGLGL